MNLNYVLVGLTLLALLSSLASVGNPPWWPWGLHAAVVLLAIVTLLRILVS